MLTLWQLTRNLSARRLMSESVPRINDGESYIIPAVRGTMCVVCKGQSDAGLHRAPCCVHKVLASIA